MPKTPTLLVRLQRTADENLPRGSAQQLADDLKELADSLEAISDELTNYADCDAEARADYRESLSAQVGDLLHDLREAGLLPTAPTA